NKGAFFGRQRRRLNVSPNAASPQELDFLAGNIATHSSGNRNIPCVDVRRDLGGFSYEHVAGNFERPGKSAIKANIGAAAQGPFERTVRAKHRLKANGRLRRDWALWQFRLL